MMKEYLRSLMNVEWGNLRKFGFVLSFFTLLVFWGCDGDDNNENYCWRFENKYWYAPDSGDINFDWLMFFYNPSFDRENCRRMSPGYNCSTIDSLSNAKEWAWEHVGKDEIVFHGRDPKVFAGNPPNPWSYTLRFPYKLLQDGTLLLNGIVYYPDVMIGDDIGRIARNGGACWGRDTVSEYEFYLLFYDNESWKYMANGFNIRQVFARETGVEWGGVHYSKWDVDSAAGRINVSAFYSCTVPGSCKLWEHGFSYKVIDDSTLEIDSMRVKPLAKCGE